MPPFPPPPVPDVDAELSALSDLIRGASRELAEVRRRQAELVDMEAALVVAVEARMRRIDELLDQRCEEAPQRRPLPASGQVVRAG